MNGEMLNGDPNHVRGLSTADVEGVWLDRNEDDIDIECWKASSSVERGDGFHKCLLLGRGEGRRVGKDPPKWHFAVGLVISLSRNLDTRSM